MNMLTKNKIKVIKMEKIEREMLEKIKWIH